MFIHSPDREATIITEEERVRQRKRLRAPRSIPGEVTLGSQPVGNEAVAGQSP